MYIFVVTFYSPWNLTILFYVYCCLKLQLSCFVNIIKLLFTERRPSGWLDQKMVKGEELSKLNQSCSMKMTRLFTRFFCNFLVWAPENQVGIAASDIFKLIKNLIFLSWNMLVISINYKFKKALNFLFFVSKKCWTVTLKYRTERDGELCVSLLSQYHLMSICIGGDCPYELRRIEKKNSNFFNKFFFQSKKEH